MCPCLNVKFVADSLGPPVGAVTVVLVVPDENAVLDGVGSVQRRVHSGAFAAFRGDHLPARVDQHGPDAQGMLSELVAVRAHRSTKCITWRGLGWRAAGWCEEKHGQPIPVVQCCGARADRDAGGGLHMPRLNPTGVTAPDVQAGCCWRDRETVAGGGASRRVRCGRFSLEKTAQSNFGGTCLTPCESA